MAILTCKRGNGSLYVSFGSDTSVRFASRIKSALSKIISLPVKKYYIDLNAVKETDISFIQLLIAFNEKLKSENRPVILLNPSSDSGFSVTALECGVDVQTMFEIEDG